MGRVKTLEERQNKIMKKKQAKRELRKFVEAQKKLAAANIAAKKETPDGVV